MKWSEVSAGNDYAYAPSKDMGYYAMDGIRWASYRPTPFEQTHVTGYVPFGRFWAT
jgi:hypothetical protein